MKNYVKCLVTSAVACSLAACTATTLPLKTHTFDSSAKQATKDTILANKAFGETLTFDDFDFKNATKGFIAQPETLRICAGNAESCGVPVWEIESYKTFIQPIGNNATGYPDEYNIADDSPLSVNPSLWRNAKLNMYYGLFSVLDKNTDSIADKGDIFQVRNYDLSNITFVRGDNGWIVFDPLISPETAKAALALLNENIGNATDIISAVIYSHSHTDHYGGVNGLSIDDNTEIYAPEHFTEHAVSENVIAGNAMGRRAVYMYGSLLERGVKGSVNAGLGMTTSTGVPGLKIPTKSVSESNELSETDTSCTIEQPGCTWDVDGIPMQFQMTPGTEAPAEMNTWLPDQDALWMAENTTNTMHNILTLRGAKVRDALKWAHYLNDTIDRYSGKAKVKFQSHHWPVWGEDNISEYLVKQRDVYKFMHDQTVRLMNQGYNGEEISEAMKLPASLEENWATRGYYGTLRHNTRAIYQYYMGWYNGNPSDLNNLPPLESAIRYVHYMGGVQNIINQAVVAYDAGDYRWVAEVLKHVVFTQSACDINVKIALPDYITQECGVPSTDAKYLLADTYEQLAYQAESGPWRSVYLQGALELRQGIDPNLTALETASPETIQAMPVDMLFDYWSVRLNANSVDNKSISYAIEFADIKANEELCNDVTGQSTEQCKYYLTVNNSVLNYTTAEPASLEGIDETIYVSKATLDLLPKVEFQYKATQAEVDDCAPEDGCVYTSSGNTEIIEEFASFLDTYNFWFNIVTPNMPLALK